MRKCIATGEAGAAEGFIRFVLSPDGVVAPDFSEKLPGRGAWVTATREALAAAVKKGAFARSFKQSATAPQDLPEVVEAGLSKRALSALGLARKTGDVVTGFDQVKSALKEKKIAVLVAAVDGAEDGRRKLKTLSKDAALIELFSGREISAALGRTGVVHAALNSGAGAERFLRAARRLERFCAQDAETEGAH
jgi:uncharacterized protein